MNSRHPGGSHETSVLNSSIATSFIQRAALPSLPIPERASEGIAERPQLVRQRGSEKLVVINLDV